MNVPQIRSTPLEQQQRFSSPRRVQDLLTIFLFLLPSFILFLLFIIYPIFRAFISVYSIGTDWDPLLFCRVE